MYIARVLIAYTRVSVAYSSRSIALTQPLCLYMIIWCRMFTLVALLPLHRESVYSLYEGAPLLTLVVRLPLRSKSVCSLYEGVACLP